MSEPRPWPKKPLPVLLLPMVLAWLIRSSCERVAVGADSDRKGSSRYYARHRCRQPFQGSFRRKDAPSEPKPNVTMSRAALWPSGQKLGATLGSLVLTVSHGTEPFFNAFGGEAIHMPLADDSSSMEKLKKLGEPVVVEVALPGEQISTYFEMAWCAISYYHRRINPATYLMESEACLSGSVPPADVLAVVPLRQFEV